jgi:hypothetical protein
VPTSVFYLPRNGQGNRENPSFVGSFEICTGLIETDQMTLSAPQFDSMVMGITEPGRFRTGVDVGGVVSVTRLPVFVSPKALCWKSVTSLSENFCYGDIGLPVLCVYGGAPLLSWSIDVGGPQAIRMSSANSAAAFVQWGTKDPAFTDATDSVSIGKPATLFAGR